MTLSTLALLSRALRSLRDARPCELGYCRDGLPSQQKHKHTIRCPRVDERRPTIYPKNPLSIRNKREKGNSKPLGMSQENENIENMAPAGDGRVTSASELGGYAPTPEEMAEDQQASGVGQASNNPGVKAAYGHVVGRVEGEPRKSDSSHDATDGYESSSCEDHGNVGEMRTLLKRKGVGARAWPSWTHADMFRKRHVHSLGRGEECDTYPQGTCGRWTS